MATNELGIQALKISLVGLGLTALFQLVIVRLSGSTALLADTIHNFGDAGTSIPLWIALLAATPCSEQALHLWLWADRGPRRPRHCAGDLPVGGDRGIRVDSQAYQWGVRDASLMAFLRCDYWISWQ
ncbi:MAG: cation transporter [Thermomicrobiales bacterium]